MREKALCHTLQNVIEFNSFMLASTLGILLSESNQMKNNDFVEKFLNFRHSNAFGIR